MCKIDNIIHPVQSETPRDYLIIRARTHTHRHSHTQIYIHENGFLSADLSLLNNTMENDVSKSHATRAVVPRSVYTRIYVLYAHEKKQNRVQVTFVRVERERIHKYVYRKKKWILYTYTNTYIDTQLWYCMLRVARALFEVDSKRTADTVCIFGREYIYLCKTNNNETYVYC